jgi:hypothetical protein
MSVAASEPFSVISIFRSAVFLGRRRVLLWSGALLVPEVVIFTIVMLWALGVFGVSRPPVAADFPSFYAAGSLVLAGTPELAYDQLAHWAAEQAVGGENYPYNYFFYPPPFLLICAPLALLPYAMAFVVFEAGTLLLYLLAVRRIAAIGGWAWCIPALAFPAVFWCLGLGQNACLTAGLFGAGTLAIDERPARGGAILGMLCYKPHFGLLVPVALAAGGHWKAFLAAAASVAAIVGATLALFGVETWARYLIAFAGSGTVYGSGKVMLSGYITAFGAARLIGAPNDLAIAVQIVVSLVSAGIVAWIWRLKASLPVRGAALIAGTLLSVPMAILYDLLLISVCIAWIVRVARERGFLSWEKLLLMALYIISLVSLFVGLRYHVPLGPLAPAIVLALCLRRTRQPVAV